MIAGVRYAHTNLVARDWRALAAFYENVFGCAPVLPEREYSGPAIEALTSLAGASLAGVHLRFPGAGPKGATLEIFTYLSGVPESTPSVDRPGFAHVAFEVDSVADALGEVLAAGGSTVGETVVLTTATGVRITVAYVTDPEGNVIELLSWAGAAGQEERPESSSPPPVAKAR